MYIFVIVGFLLDLMVFQLEQYLTTIQRFILGLVLFIPAVLQVKWKFKHRYLKFTMRAFLGLAIWFIVSFVFYTNSLFLRVGGIIGLITGIIIYYNLSAVNKLLECESCRYDQNYNTCLIRFQDILAVDNLEHITGDDQLLTKILALKSRAKHSDAIILPTEEIT